MNNNHIVFFLTKRGLCSELLFLINTVLLANIKNIKITINDSIWNLRVNHGWNDYFTANDYFTIEKSQKIYFSSKFEIKNIKDLYWTAKYAHTIYFVKNNKPEEGKQLYKFLKPLYYYFTTNNNTKIDVLGIYPSRYIKSKESILWKKIYELTRNKINNACQINSHNINKKRIHIAKNIWSLNEEIKNNIEHHKQKFKFNKRQYIGLHIRRGDKLIKEAEYIPISNYISVIEMLELESLPIFIATDDYSVVTELYKLRPLWKIHSLSNPILSGHDQDVYNAQSKEKIYNSTNSFLTEIDILIQANIYIGTITSNVSKVISLLRNCKTKTFTLDNELDTYNCYKDLITYVTN